MFASSRTARKWSLNLPQQREVKQWELWTCFWFPVPDQDLIWSGPKPCSYFCACSPEGSIEQAMTQTRLTCSTVFLAEDRNLCDAAPKFIPIHSLGKQLSEEDGAVAGSVQSSTLDGCAYLPWHSDAALLSLENCFEGKDNLLKAREKRWLFLIKTKYWHFLPVKTFVLEPLLRKNTYKLRTKSEARAPVGIMGDCLFLKDTGFLVMFNQGLVPEMPRYCNNHF